jgi:hypothetical protein
MKGSDNVPTLLYFASVLLAMAFWFVLFSSRIDGFANDLYFLFMPLIGTPYVLWVVHKEGQEPEGYYKDTYAGHAGLMWCIRIFMMVVVSALSSVAAIIILCALSLISTLFK